MQYTLHLGYKKTNLLMQHKAKSALYSEINKKHKCNVSAMQNF